MDSVMIKYGNVACRENSWKSAQKTFSSFGFNNEQNCMWTTTQAEETVQENSQKWCEVNARKQEVPQDLEWLMRTREVND